MPVPYGFGVGDFVAVGTLAWNVYKSCKAAPGSFSNISSEVLSLHAVLKEAEETIFRSPLPPKRQERLKTIDDGCQSVLSDLQALVDKYENLGTQSKRTWDRMKWGAEDIIEIRSRLISNTTMLTAYISTSQASVEQKLDKLISDIQQGKRAPSVVSLQTVDSLNPDDKETWRTIRKELEDIGVSIAAFDANKDFIFEWFSNAVDMGAFQEKAGSSPPGSVHSLDVQSSASSLSSSRVKESKKDTVMSDTEPPNASKAKTKQTEKHTVRQVEQASNRYCAAGRPHAPAIPTKVPRFAALLASLSQPQERLNDAVLAGDLDRARNILTDPVTSCLINKPTLNDALDWAIRANSKEACALLIDAGADIIDGSLYHHALTMHVCTEERNLTAFLLDRGVDLKSQSGTGKPLMTLAVCNTKRDLAAFLLDSGADVNYESKNGETPLTIAVRHGKSDFAALLLDRGANVNYQSGDGTAYSSALRAAITNDDEAMITFLSQRGADLNAVQECNEDRYSGYPTAIHQATAESRLAIVVLLINLGADFNSPQRHCGNPLMLSIYHRCVSSAELLIKRGANINEVNVPQKHHDRLFYSAIHVAIFVSSPYLVGVLLRNGVGTDLDEAYEFAAQHIVRLANPGRDQYNAKLLWEPRDIGKLLNDARQVQTLLKERKCKSAVRV